MIIQFSVHSTPRPQPRPRLGNRRAYEPAYIAEYKHEIAIEARRAMHHRPPFLNPVEVHIIIRRDLEPTSRSFGDIDNHMKAVLDAMNGVVYDDDRLAVTTLVHKLRSKREGLDVTIFSMED